jgi:long-chain acyl-CoA synthetase
MLLRRVEATPEAPAFLYPERIHWRTLTWSETGERVRAIACGLLSMGLGSEERCAILSSTRIEWILADLGILAAGGATTTIYPASTAEDCVHILRDSGAAFVFIEDPFHFVEIAGRRGEIPGVRGVILLEGSGSEDGWAVSLAELETRGRDWDAANPGGYERSVGRIGPDSLATLIYTSGTTGPPKGVELTHRSWMYEAEGIEAIEMLRPDDLQYFWLPLAHVFGKVLQAAQIRIGFATAVDGRVDRLVENLRVLRPTFVCAVPRVFEKVRHRILGRAQAGGRLKSGLFRWALATGREVSRIRRSGGEQPTWLAAKAALADLLVFRKLRRIFGGRLRFFISGSAPLGADLAEFFHSFGILLLEGYGLTESSAATFVNRPAAFRFGTVGLPLPGTEVRTAADGEILLRGPGVMKRYHNQPEATADALDSGGWLHTGDIGKLDGGGYLTIADRKKDLIKTSGGKYVAPLALEARLALLCRFVDQVLVHGDNRKFCSALITLNESEVRSWAVKQGLAHKPLADLAADVRVRALVRSAVEELNAKVPRHESIRRFALLPSEFSVETGELTPSLKPRRRVIEQKYAGILASFYEPSSKQGAACDA